MINKFITVRYVVNSNIRGKLEQRDQNKFFWIFQLKSIAESYNNFLVFFLG